jgi:hypothetical protein
MFFLKKEEVSDFQDRCVVAIFLKFHEQIKFVRYVEKNHFVGRTDNNDIQHIFLFNTPSKNIDFGVVYRFKNGSFKQGYVYDILGAGFINEYRIFADNPYDYIKKHFFYEEWEDRFRGLFVSIPPEEGAMLYKYKSNPNEKDSGNVHRFDAFMRGRLTFVNPSTCNDPFDCECEIPLHEALPVVVYRAIAKTKYSKSPLKKIPLGVISKLIDAFYEVYGDEFDASEEAFERLINYICDRTAYYPINNDEVISNCVGISKQMLNLKNEFRILCLARNPKDILMWGYYGNSGKGVCCGHKPDDIKKAILDNYNCICIYGNVRYPERNDRPKFRAKTGDLADDILNFIVECTFTKYYNWKHEKEFRYLLLGGSFTDDYVSIDSTASEIYLGCKSKDVNYYKKASFYPTPHVLRMHPKKYELI